MLAPPRPPADPEALIPEARERQRRRQLALVAVSAVAAGLGIAVYALLGGLGQKNATDGSPLGAGAPLCRSSQLSPDLGIPEGPFSGVWVVVTNSGGACSLPPGVPTVHVVGRDQLLPIHEVHRVGLSPAGWLPLRTARVLQHGAKAGITINWLNWCGPPKLTNRDFEIYHVVFRGGATFAFRLGPKPACTSPDLPSTIAASRPLRVP